MTDVQKKTVVSKDGSVIYYERYAGKDDLPMLFFVHGIGGDTDGWEFVRNPLLLKGYPGIAMDLRGHGYSDHPKQASAYTIERIEEDLQAVFDAEKIQKPILIAHSGGAVVAAQFATSKSNLLAGLVLINGSYCPPAWLASRFLHAVANVVISIGGFISLPPYRRWHSPYPLGKFHHEIEIYGLVRTMFYNSLRSYLYTSYTLINVDLRDQLEKISVPTLLVASERDGIFPVAIQEEMRAKIPNSKLVILKNTNHVSVLNNAVGVANAILDFLRF